MPDKKLTDNEIIKALECCVKDDNIEADNKACLECPMNDDNACTFNLRKYTLDLVNRQKAENERLKEEKETLKPLLDSSQERYFGISNLAHKYRNKVKTAKAEAYKEFANWQEIKLANNPNISTVALQSIIATNDNLLKELVGERSQMKSEENFKETI